MIVRTEHHFAWEKVDFVIYCRTPIRSIARNLGVMSSDHVLAADIKKALPVSNPEGPCTNFTNNKNIINTVKAILVILAIVLINYI